MQALHTCRGFFHHILYSCLSFAGGKTDPGVLALVTSLTVEALKKSAASERVMLQGLNEVFLWLCRCEKAEGHHEVREKSR